MKRNYSFSFLVLIALLLGTLTVSAQTQLVQTVTAKKTYLIERDIPGASKLTPEQLKSISQTSCSVLKEMGPRIEWMHSYVAGDKIFCVYQAENEGLLKEHAKKGGFPITSIKEIGATISPATAQ